MRISDWSSDVCSSDLYHRLPDAGRIQESEAERRNRRKDRKDEEPIEPIYTEADSKAAYDQIETVELNKWFQPARGFTARLWYAGHMLGTPSVEIQVGETRMLFSGDLGPAHKIGRALCREGGC